MKFLLYCLIFVFLLVTDKITSVSSQNPETCPKCTVQSCTFEFEPVCGKKQLLSGSWEQRIFSNKCQMDNENLCGGGYIPCCYFDRSTTLSETIETTSVSPSETFETTSIAPSIPIFKKK